LQAQIGDSVLPGISFDAKPRIGLPVSLALRPHEGKLI